MIDVAKLKEVNKLSLTELAEILGCTKANLSHAIKGHRQLSTALEEKCMNSNLNWQDAVISESLHETIFQIRAEIVNIKETLSLIDEKISKLG